MNFCKKFLKIFSLLFLFNLLLFESTFLPSISYASYPTQYDIYGDEEEPEEEPDETEEEKEEREEEEEVQEEVSNDEPDFYYY